MKPKVLIYFAIGLITLHLAGHAAGHFQWDDVRNPEFGSVVKVMKSHQGQFMGATRTMADYYHGYSLILFVLFGISIGILWLCATAQQTLLVKRLLAILSAGYLILAVIEWIYFFPFASLVSLLTALLLLTASRKVSIS